MTTTTKSKTSTPRRTHATLAAALAAFQAELPKVVKNASNPHFKNKFADLTELSNVVLPVLGKHGLAWSAMPNMVEGRGMVLETTLLHESGEKMTGAYPLVGSTPQQIGSAITYARRYALAAVTGVAADDDDDGELASTTSAATPGAGFTRQSVDVVDSDLAQAISGCKDLETLAVLHKQAHERGMLTPAVAGLFKARQQTIKATIAAAVTAAPAGDEA